MNLSLPEYTAILDELAEKYVKQYINETGITDQFPRYADFEKHLVENYGINGKNQVLDKEKWLHYILSRG